MHVTMADMMPVGLCLATHELFDVKRYKQNFGDHSVLRLRDANMEQVLRPMKIGLNSRQDDLKFLEGHKAVIVSNTDKILSLALTRYGALSIKSMESISKEGRSIMRKVAEARTFDDIFLLEPVFKSKIVLPVYELFLESMKRTAQGMSR